MTRDQAIQLAAAVLGDKQLKRLLARATKRAKKLSPAQWEAIRPFTSNVEYWAMVKAGLINPDNLGDPVKGHIDSEAILTDESEDRFYGLEIIEQDPNFNPED